MRQAFLAAVLGLGACWPAGGAAQQRTLPAGVPSAKEMAAAREDVWAEAAIRQPGGPSYEFFEPLLPPLRYVNTAFRHYPVVLSAPAAPVKARWISNGSGVNLRADKPPMWRELGTPVAFFVGTGGEAFGADAVRRSEPDYAEGFLPIVRIEYRQGGTTYQQEAFALTTWPGSAAGAVLVRFSCRDQRGTVAAKIGGEEELTLKGAAVCNAQGEAIVIPGQEWQWDASRRKLQTTIEPGASATLCIATQPLAPPHTLPAWIDERQAAVRLWQSILERGSQLAIPEPLVQDAWRALVLGNFAIASGDNMNYSAGNAYDHLYEGECGDAVRALLLLGQSAEARRMVGPLLDFNRQATRFHVAGHKLQLLAHYYWITRDADYLREKRAVWEPVANFIRTSRRTENGLLPKDNYAGDIPQQVYSLSSNSNCWRGLRDLSAVLNDVGEKTLAAELAKKAAEFRQSILAAVANSERKDTQPPFIPIALLADEPPHDPLTATRMGSYYDLMIPYVLGSGVFGPGDEREGHLIEYLRQHGGLALGMIRSMPHQGEFNGEPGVNVLYGQRYLLAILRRGDREHALAGFYGQLAHGMTRGTFIGGEGSRFFHGDERGRSFYLPPNAASNAMFLTSLRYLLVQDWDLDDDGRPETLRLLDAIPPRWLTPEKPLELRRLPTAFGELSLRLELQPAARQVRVAIELPPRGAERLTLRVPAPPGFRLHSAKLDGSSVMPDADGRFDLSGRRGSVKVLVNLSPNAR